MGQVLNPLFLLLRAMWEKGKLVAHAFTGEGNEGIAVFICGDCDKFPQMFEQLQDAYRALGQKWARTHVIALNGGPLCLSPEWPQQFARFAAEDSLELAYRKKGVRKIDLIPHFPCGKVGDMAMSPTEMLRHLQLAVKSVQSAYPDCEVRLKSFVDWPPGFIVGLGGVTLHHLSLDSVGEGEAEAELSAPN